MAPGLGLKQLQSNFGLLHLLWDCIAAEWIRSAESVALWTTTHHLLSEYAAMYAPKLNVGQAANGHRWQPCNKSGVHFRDHLMALSGHAIRRPKAMLWCWTCHHNVPLHRQLPVPRRLQSHDPEAEVWWRLGLCLVFRPHTPPWSQQKCADAVRSMGRPVLSESVPGSVARTVPVSRSHQSFHWFHQMPVPLIAAAEQKPEWSSAVQRIHIPKIATRAKTTKSCLKLLSMLLLHFQLLYSSLEETPPFLALQAQDTLCEGVSTPTSALPKGCHLWSFCISPP